MERFLKNADRRTALNLLSLLAVFAGLVIGLKFGFELFWWSGSAANALLTAGGAALFVFGLALKVGVERNQAVEGKKLARLERDSRRAPLTKVSKVSLFVIGMAACFHPPTAATAAGLRVPRSARVAAHVLLVVVFLVFCAVWRERLGQAWKVAYQVVALSALATLVLYLGVIGVLLPRRVFEEDLALRSALARIGIRSLLGLRVAGVFFLLGSAVVTVRIVVPGLLGRL